MKIYGPYKRKDGRSHIIKIFKSGKRQTQSYPRFLMEVHLKRKLLLTEHIDHKDDNYTNNNINNLQILTQKQNNIKERTRPHRKLKIYKGSCPICFMHFEKPLYQITANNKKQGKAGPFCSRSCAGKYSHTV